jgi:Secretion system C-terminal sorting domain/Reeler domain
MRKKLLILTGVVVFTTIFIGSIINPAITDPDGSPNARTGSPGDGGNTCAISGCHTGIQVSTRSGLITSNIPSEGYTGGVKYTFTLTAKTATNRNKFGFQISPQSQVGSTIGTMTVTNASQTKLTGGGKYLTHTLAGNAGSNGQKTWSFDWTAPTAGTGAVTFYACFNYANGDGGSSGDSIIKSTYVVNEKVAIGISNTKFSSLGFSVYPLPANEFFNLRNEKAMPISNIYIYDLNARLVKTIAVDSSEEIRVETSELNAGVYVIRLEHKGILFASSKIVVQ